MNRAFLFQGQGSQAIGMGQELYNNFPLIRELYEQANDILGYDLTSIILNGSKEELDLTVNTQPALMLHSISILRLIEHLADKKIDELCNIVAGHSLGEYTAVCAIRAIGFEDCLKLLKLRGQSMQNAVTLGRGGMAALIGLTEEELANVLSEASKFGTCEVANDNCPGQIVISGLNEAISEAVNIVKAMGKKAIKLEVSAPFHCSLMEPVKEIMTQAMEEISFNEPLVPLIANATATITEDSEEIKSLLVRQITAPVKWRESIQFLSDHHCKSFFEIGTGKVLVGLGKRISDQSPFIALNSINTIEDFIQTIK